LIKEPIKQFQLVYDPDTGDCFRACWATILALPIETIINPQDDRWWFHWREWMKQFGLEILHGANCWQPNYWIASVTSLNFEGVSHAIVMKGQEVFFDPSTKNRYEEGRNLLGDKEANIISGFWLGVDDPFKLHKLRDHRKRAWQNLNS